MRVAVVAECFLPECNGVTNSVLRVLEHLAANAHEALVVAPGPGPDRYLDTPVERVPAVALPFYRSLSVGLPTDKVRRILQRFDADVVHLAAPVVLGAVGVRAARRLGVPTVAVYQTDLAGFAGRYGMGAASPAVWAWLRSVHNQVLLHHDDDVVERERPVRRAGRSRGVGERPRCAQGAGAGSAEETTSERDAGRCCRAASQHGAAADVGGLAHGIILHHRIPVHRVSTFPLRERYRAHQ